MEEDKSKSESIGFSWAKGESFKFGAFGKEMLKVFCVLILICGFVYYSCKNSFDWNFAGFTAFFSFMIFGILFIQVKGSSKLKN